MIYIIIPVFNRWNYTFGCLSSFNIQTDQKFRLVVVDHGSTDGTSELIKQQFPDVVLLKGDESMWWSAATNLGIRYAIKAGADFVLTLNNDTIATNNYISSLYDAIALAPENSLIGSAAINEETGELTYLGEKIEWFTSSIFYNLKSLKAIPKQQLIEVSHFPGRGLLIPKRVIEDIGLFDEKCFPHYMADYDFTMRALKSGYRTYCFSDARIVTFPEASGANQLRRRKSVKAYYYHLFGMKGNANLPLYFKYAFRHCPSYALPFHLVIGTARRVIGYWIK